MVSARARKLEVRQYALEHGLSYLQALAKLQPTVQSAFRGQVIGFSSARGGGGKTSFTLLIAKLLRDAGKRVVVIDGDLQDGQIRGLVDGASGYSSYDLKLRAESEGLTEELVKAAVHSDHPNGISFLYAPERPRNGTDDLIDQISFAVAVLRKSYDYVLIDSGVLWEGVPATQAFLGLSDRIAVVTGSLELHSLESWRTRSGFGGSVLEIRRVFSYESKLAAADTVTVPLLLSRDQLQCLVAGKPSDLDLGIYSEILTEILRGA